jgi:hypothetical protein
MERAGQLLDKVVELYRSGASREELLQAIQFLQSEVAGQSLAMPRPEASRSGKVSVILPFHTVMPETAPNDPLPVTRPTPPEEKIIQVLQVDERELEAELEELKRSAELKNELSIKVRQARVEWDDPLDEIPTLASHRDYLPKSETPLTTPMADLPGEPPVQVPDPGKDLNDMMVRSDTSLNDRLRNVQAELSEKLQEAPLREAGLGPHLCGGPAGGVGVPACTPAAAAGRALA